jgi:tRNA G18 (ribose-2'-O)-methylase SpoU
VTGIVPASQDKTALATPIIIKNADDPRIEAYRNIQERDLVGRKGCFIAEGEVVLRLLLTQSHFAIETILLSERRAAASEDLLALVPADVPVYITDDTILEQIAGFHVHRGVLATGRKATPKTLKSTLAALPEKALIVVCIGIANHDNIGGIFRNAAAFGASAVLLDTHSCDPLYRKAIRVSVGSTLVVPFVQEGDENDIISALLHEGFTALALSPTGDGILADIVPASRTALFLGAEGSGLSPELIKRMEAVRIPMANNFDSLNVATTSGIALHHLFRS